MQFLLPHSESPAKLDRFLQRHGLAARLTQQGESVAICVDDSGMTVEQRETLQRHFSFYDIFEWSAAGAENVLLWEIPGRMQAVIEQLEQLYCPDDFDVLATLESKGFILAGALAYAWRKPLLAVRKYKPLFDTLPGYRADFTNWRRQPESLYLFQRPGLISSRALLVDDVLETGNSLQAAASLLQQASVQLQAAFYLLDAATTERRQSFEFPVRSLLRYHDLFGNTAVRLCRRTAMNRG